MEPPVIIPNTEVKRSSADDTEGGTPWENMSLPEDLRNLQAQVLFVWQVGRVQVVEVIELRVF